MKTDQRFLNFNRYDVNQNYPILCYNTPMQDIQIQTNEQKIILLESKIKKLQKQLSESRVDNQILAHQSKMALLGEMLGNIAHQWRQPLMELSSIIMSMEAKVKLTGEVSNEEIIDTAERSSIILKYMSSTIDDFRDFFVKDKAKIIFKMSDQIKRSINMLHNTLDNKNIKVDIIIKANPQIYGYKNEYSQVLMNLISNAKDVLVERKIHNPKIVVKIYQDEKYCITEVSDNAGGVKVEPITKVFESFFTFEKKDGTGIGLFMSKLIVEKNMDGKLEVHNNEDGACFTIKIPLLKKE